MHNYKIALLAAACLMTACSKECEKTLTISVHPEGTGTKTVLMEDRSVAFTDTDCLAVFDNLECRKFTASAVYDDGSADFTGSLTTPANGYVAVYPYQNSCYVYGNSICITIPDVQNAVAGSFDPAANISVGRSVIVSEDTHSLTLKNVCSLIKFAVPEGKTYKAASIMTSNLYLAGEMFCTPGDVPTLEPTGETIASSVTLIGTITGGNWYYIAVRPVDLSDGFALYLYDKAEDVENYNYATIKYTTNAVSFERSRILNLGIIGAEFGAGFEPLAGETVLEW